jgi:hypothetical protein
MDHPTPADDALGNPIYNTMSNLKSVTSNPTILKSSSCCDKYMPSIGAYRLGSKNPVVGLFLIGLIFSIIIFDASYLLFDLSIATALTILFAVVFYSLFYQFVIKKKRWRKQE